MIENLDDLKQYHARLHEFVARAEERGQRISEPYSNTLRFVYKGREYDLQQAVYEVPNRGLQYQHFLRRDGRLLNMGALRKVLAEMSWDLRYVSTAEALYG